MVQNNHERQNNASEPIPRSSPDALLATKFLLPVSSHEIVARPHLLALLNAGLRQRVMLLSAAAGFGKGIVKLLFEEARSREKTLAERTRGGGNWRKGPLYS